MTAFQTWKHTEVGATALSPQFLSTVGMAFLFMLGYSLVGPLLPTVVGRFDVSSAGAGLLLSSFALGRLMFDLLAGVLGDRFGIRSIAVFACVLTLVASLVAAITGDYPVLLAARVVQGIGSALYMTVAMSLVLDLAPAGHVGKMLSIHQGAGFLGITAGPAIGGLVAEHWGITGIFLVYGSFALIGIGPSWRWLPGRRLPTADADTASSGRRKLLHDLLTNRSFVIVLLASFVVFWLRSGIGNTVIPLFAAEQFGFTEASIGALLTVAAAGNLMVLWPAGRSVDTSGRRAVLLRSMVGLVLVVGLFAVMVNPLIVFIVSAALGAVKGYAAVVPGAVLADLADPRIRGAGVGVLRMTTDLGLLLGPVGAGALADAVGNRSTFVIAAAVAAVMAVVSLGVEETGEGEGATG